MDIRYERYTCWLRGMTPALIMLAASRGVGRLESKA